MADPKRAPVQAAETFGRLTTIEKIHRVTSGGTKVAAWVCRCDCGAVAEVRASNLTNGHALSCGCLHSEVSAALLTTHGGTGSLAYRRWEAMMDRCYCESSAAYLNYGAKGVAVAQVWHEFPRFLADMGQPPTQLHTLDRLENAKGYEPGNCRWATMHEQQRNRTNNNLVTAHGRTQCVAAWAEDLGVNAWTIYSRLKRGVQAERALHGP